MEIATALGLNEVHYREAKRKAWSSYAGNDLFTDTLKELFPSMSKEEILIIAILCELEISRQSGLLGL